MSTGFKVAPAQLDTTAGTLRDLNAKIRDVQQQVAAENLPSSAFGTIEQSETAAKDYASKVKDAGESLSKVNSRLDTVVTGVTQSATGYRDTDAQIAQSYRSLMTTGADGMPTLKSAAGGPMASGPWGQQIIANRAAVATALNAQEQRLADLQANGGSADDITNAKNRIALYENILDNQRNILQFDDSGNGKMVELFGNLDSNTQHVGVFVPGTFSGNGNYASYATMAQDMVNADPNKSLAMIVYSDGRSPQSLVTQAPFPGYANTMAPDLASFTGDVRNEMNMNSPGASMIVAGHSYGAATVGAARLQPGFSADGIMSLEGAGVGPGIYSPSDLPAGQQNIPMYSMTAPHDPIAAVQGDSPLYPIAHNLPFVGGLLPDRSPLGADPDTFPGTVDMSTGNLPYNGHWYTGGFDASQHTAVLTPYSDAWWNIYRVYTGQPPVTP